MNAREGQNVGQSAERNSADTPTVTGMRVIPVAGRDSMELNLSGAHGPYFTRNIVILEDSAGHIGLGEVPGGENIRRTLEDARPLVVGRKLGEAGQKINDKINDPAFQQKMQDVGHQAGDLASQRPGSAINRDDLRHELPPFRGFVFADSAPRRAGQAPRPKLNRPARQVFSPRANFCDNWPLTPPATALNHPAHGTCPGGGIGRRARFRSVCRKAWRFESSSGHHYFLKRRGFSPLFSFLPPDRSSCLLHGPERSCAFWTCSVRASLPQCGRSAAGADIGRSLAVMNVRSAGS